MFRSRAFLVFFWLLAAAVAVAFLSQLGIVKLQVGTLDSSGDSSVERVHTSYEAYSLCSQQLIANAEKPEATHVPPYDVQSPDTTVADRGAGSYTVASVIDVQTDTGAIVRHHYNCEISYAPDGAVRVGWNIVD